MSYLPPSQNSNTLKSTFLGSIFPTLFLIASKSFSSSFGRFSSISGTPSSVSGSVSPVIKDRICVILKPVSALVAPFFTTLAGGFFTLLLKRVGLLVVFLPYLLTILALYNLSWYSLSKFINFGYSSGSLSITFSH